MQERDHLELCDEFCAHDEAVRRARELLPDEDRLFELSEFYKLFADSTRIRILCALAGTELCVCDIAEALNMTQSAISHQLSLLKKGKLVRFRREGKTVYYTLSDDHVHGILEQGLEHIEE